MKAVIVCALALVALAALVHGKDEWLPSYNAFISPQSDRELEPSFPYSHVLRIRRSDRICVPGSTKTVECDNHCFCIAAGSGWACTEKGCEVHKIASPGQADPLPGA